MTTASADSKLQPAAPPEESITAVLLGLTAAATYSIANMALRDLAQPESGIGWDMWVSGTKAIPTFLVAVAFILYRRLQSLGSFAEWSFVRPIAIAAIFNQIGGNFAFQLSLKYIGLAVSVPICFASIICSGAVAGRIVIGDRVTLRTAASIAVMMTAIIFLSSGARARTTNDDAGEVASADAELADSVLSVLPGVTAAVISGLSYGVSGVYIRYAVRSKMPIAGTLFLFSGAGFLTLCPASLTQLSTTEILQISWPEWQTIIVAGTFNALGFFSITTAMKHLNISRANVINASQNAMCAAGAVLVFGEPVSTAALVGIVLTIGGLLLLGIPVRGIRGKPRITQPPE